MSPNPLRDQSRARKSGPSNLRMIASAKSAGSRLVTDLFESF